MCNLQLKIIAFQNTQNVRKVSGRGYKNAVSDTLEYLRQMKYSEDYKIPLKLMITWQKKMEYIKISNFGCRFNSGSFRVRAPLEIMIGHLKQDNFYPVYEKEITRFIFTISESDKELFMWVLKIILFDAALQMDEVDELRHNQAVACKGLLKEMLFQVNQISKEEFNKLVALLYSIPSPHSKVGKLIRQLIVETENTAMFGIGVAFDNAKKKSNS